MPSTPKQVLNRGHWKLPPLPRKSQVLQKTSPRYQVLPRTSPRVRTLVIIEKLALGDLNFRCFLSSLPITFLWFSLFWGEMPHPFLLCQGFFWKWPTELKSQPLWPEHTVQSTASADGSSQLSWAMPSLTFIPKTRGLWCTNYWRVWPEGWEGLLRQLGFPPQPVEKGKRAKAGQLIQNILQT